MTPAQLRAEADARDAAGRAALDAGDARAAAVAFHQAQVCRLAADELEKLQTGLRSNVLVGTLGTMETAQVRSRGAAVSEARTSKDDKAPFQQALHDKRLSLPEWVATRKGLNLETAKSWVKKPGKGGRPIPRLWADRIAAEFEAPALALAESWPNGIRE